MPEDKTIELIYTRFEKARECPARKDFDDSVTEGKRAFKGRVFSQSEETSMKEAGIPPVYVARGMTNALRLASILTANRPELKAIAKGRGDGAIATLIGRAYKKIWEENNAQMKNFRVVLALIREGLSGFNCKSEKVGLAGDVNIKIGRLNSQKTYYDPETEEDNLEDWKYRFLARAMTPEEAKGLYGLAEDELYYELAKKPDDKETGTDHDSIPGGSYDDAPGGQAKERKRTVWELEYWEKLTYTRKLWFDQVTSKAFPRVDKEKQDNKIKMTWAYKNPSEIPINERFQPIEIKQRELRYKLIAGKKIVIQTTNPYGLNQLGEPVDPAIEIVNIPIGETYPRGNMYYAIWPLKEISKRRGQSIAVVAATTGSPIVAKKSTVNIAEWQKKLSKPREVLEWDGEPEDKPSPLYTNLPDLSRVFVLEQRAESDLNDVFNLTPILKGETETGRMSGRLAAMLKEFGMEGNSYLITALEEAYRKLGVCLIVMALREWPFHYWERLIEDEDRQKDEQGNVTAQVLPEFIKALELIKTKDVSIIDYDIGIRSGSSLPANRMARLDMALELAKEPVHPDAIYDAEAVLDYLDDPQAGQVLKRKGKMRQMTMQLQEMTGNMEQMADRIKELGEESGQRLEIINKMKVDHEIDKLNIKGRMEIALEKEKLRNQALKGKKSANSGK